MSWGEIIRYRLDTGYDLCDSDHIAEVHNDWIRAQI